MKQRNEEETNRKRETTERKNRRWHKVIRCKWLGKFTGSNAINFTKCRRKKYCSKWEANRNRNRPTDKHWNESAIKRTMCRLPSGKIKKKKNCSILCIQIAHGRDDARNRNNSFEAVKMKWATANENYRIVNRIAMRKWNLWLQRLLLYSQRFSRQSQMHHVDTPFSVYRKRLWLVRDHFSVSSIRNRKKCFLEKSMFSRQICVRPSQVNSRIKCENWRESRQRNDRETPRVCCTVTFRQSRHWSISNDLSACNSNVGRLLSLHPMQCSAIMIFCCCYFHHNYAYLIN